MHCAFSISRSPRCFIKAAVIVAIALLPFGIAGQSRTTSIQKSPVASKAVPTPTPATLTKKNEGKANARPGKVVAESTAFTPTFSYTFERPGFTYSKVVVEHDEKGKGQISMTRDGSPDVFTDPIQLSSGTISALKGIYTDLNFLDSAEIYQDPARDYPHLGNITITRRSEGKQRTVKFNWTENKAAKALMDEYRGIANEYTWKLDLESARENQPLLTPGLIEAFDGYVQRNEVSDPAHLVPFLTELSRDERIPLIGRNRAARIVERIQKASKKGR